MVRLDASRLGVVLAPRQVIEPQRDPVAHGLRQRQQNIERHRGDRRLARTPHRRDLNRVEPMTEPRRKHLAHRRESPDRGLADPGTERRRRPQSDRDGECLIVVEEERGHVVASFEPVSAVGSHRRLDAVTHLAQPIDVAPHPAIADPEPRRQHRSRPVAPGLQGYWDALAVDAAVVEPLAASACSAWLGMLTDGFRVT